MSKKREGGKALSKRGGPPSKRQKGGGGGGGKGGAEGPHAAKAKKKQHHHQNHNKLHADVPLADNSNGSEDHDDEDDPDLISEEDAEFVREHASSVGWLADLDERSLGQQVLSRQAAEAAAQERREQARRQRQELREKGEQQQRKGGGDGGGEDDDGSDDEEEADYERQPRGLSSAKKPGQNKDDDDEGPALPVKGPDGRLIFLKGNEQQRRRQQLRLLALAGEGGEGGEGDQAAAKDAGTTSPALVRASDVVPNIPGVYVTDALDEEEAAAREEAKRREAERKAAAEKRAQAEAARKRAAAVHPGLAAIAAAPDRMARREVARTQLALAATQALGAEGSTDPPPAAALGSALRLLNALASDAQDAYVARLAQLSLLAVFRDLAPGYRIRLDADGDGAGGGGGDGDGGGGGGKGGGGKAGSTPVSKEVQRLRDYESALLKGYQAYLKTLLAATDRGEERVALPPVQTSKKRKTKGDDDDDDEDNDDDEDDDQHAAEAAAVAAAAAAAAELEARRAGARVAVRCMSGLLTALPHFNYSSDLLRALVARMASRDAEARAAAVAAVGATARAYAAGGATSRLALEAVQLVADLVRRRRCVCPPETVACLLDVRLEAAAAAAQAMRGVDERDLSAAELNRRRQKGRMAANAARKQALRDKRKGKGGGGGLNSDPAAAVAQDGGRGGGRSAAMQRAVREAGEAALVGLGRDLAEGDVHDARGAAEAARVQSRMVEAMFEIFFRVVKHCTAALKASAATAAAASAASAASAADASPSPGGGGKKNKKKNNPDAQAAGWAQDDDAALLAAAREDQQAEWPAGRVAKKFPLLAPSLQGIARHAHLLSVEYLPDLATALQALLEPPSPLPLRERLHVLDCAARALLRGQGEALLAVDRRGLLRALYAALLMVPLHPLHDADFFVADGSGGGRGGGAAAASPLPKSAEEERAEADADARDAVAARLHAAGGGRTGGGGGDNNQNAAVTPLPTPVLLVRVCEAFLLEGGRNAVDAPTLAAFAKRLCTVAASASSPGESVPLCSLVVRLVRRHPRLSALLEWGEDAGAVPVGGRPYDPFCREPADAGALGTALWELPAMAARHWHPHVAGAARQALASLSGGGGGGGASGGGGGASSSAAGAGAAAPNAQLSASVGPLVAAMSPQELAAAYDVLRTGHFRPAPRTPSRHGGDRSGDRGGERGGGGASKFVVQGQEARRRAALAAVEGDGLLLLEVGAGESSSLAAAAAEGVARHVSAARRSERNAKLRRERRALEKRLALFREHLIRREAGKVQKGKRRD